MQVHDRSQSWNGYKPTIVSFLLLIIAHTFKFAHLKILGFPIGGAY